MYGENIDVSRQGAQKRKPAAEDKVMGAFFIYNGAYAGKCYWAEKRSRVTGVFSYDEGYLAKSDNWNIDPALSLAAGAQTAHDGLPGAFRDAAPDRWGQNLMNYRHQREAKAEGRKPRVLNEVDYLLGANDLIRQGGLRFSLEKGGDFLHPSGETPKLSELPKLLDAARRYTEECDEKAIACLLDAGSASLGGARPKAAVSDTKDQYIAKFPHSQDGWDVIAWEWVSLSIAGDAGINVPELCLIPVDGQKVLLLKRFDREPGKRIGYISAMTLLGLSDGEQADYSEIAENLRGVSASAKEDLHELFRRIVFSVLINNTDDHLRNHGFLRSGSGWRLSPVFDVNPNPDPAAVRSTRVFSETEKQASLAALTANADAFDLSEGSASQIINSIKASMKSLEEYASLAGIPKTEQRFMLRALGLAI